MALFFLSSVMLISGCVQPSLEEPVADVMEKKDSEGLIDKVASQEAFTGQEIVPGATPLIRFNKADYDLALSQSKIVYLFFHANWCPICNKNKPERLAAFQELNNLEIVGFEAHFRDNQTNAEDEDVARRFGIINQYSTVILDKQGNVAFKTFTPLDKEEIKNEILKVAG